MAYPGKVSDELYAGRVCLDLFGFYYTTFFYPDAPSAAAAAEATAVAATVAIA